MPRAEESAAAGRTVVGRKPHINAEQRMATLHARLKERGLKSTGQRDDIARVFFEHGGYATIYRTLRLLRECNLLQERHFDDGQARYEAVDEHHHDHFICERCGKIIEFENDSIERLQEAIARQLGAQLRRHKMELYGVCADCLSGRTH